MKVTGSGCTVTAGRQWTGPVSVEGSSFSSIMFVMSPHHAQQQPYPALSTSVTAGQWKSRVPGFLAIIVLEYKK